MEYNGGERNTGGFAHKSVLLKECIEGLNIKPDGTYIDGTVGGGGHSAKIAERLDESGTLICVDQDTDAINASSQVLAGYKFVRLVHGNFAELPQILDKLEICDVDGVLLDLGVSSYQLDEPSRGFSFLRDAPLDMRMNREEDLTAYDVVNSYGEKELADIIYNYGEERFSRRIAEFIVKERQAASVKTTFELAEIIDRAVPKKFRDPHKHPATRTFQALRIEVNGELEILEKAIENITGFLRLKGRLCVITFHSLEDRIIKNTFRRLENPCDCPRDFPVCVCGKSPAIKVITRKPIIPTAEELDSNIRSRSAKLRIAEKI